MLEFIVKTGDLAYVETLTSGMVPCKVLAVEDSRTYLGMRVKVRYTANRGWCELDDHNAFVFPKGETDWWSTTTIVARKAVRFRKYNTKTIGVTKVIPDGRDAYVLA